MISLKESEEFAILRGSLRRVRMGGDWERSLRKCVPRKRHLKPYLGRRMRDEGKERRATCLHSPNSLKTGQEAVGTSGGLACR